jgi:hypothetical protein
MRPYIGTAEFLNRKRREILFLADASPSDLKAMPLVMDRIAKVKQFRANSKKPETRKLSQYPTLLEEKTIPDQPFTIIPKVSSKRREYAPIAYPEPPIIPSNATIFCKNISLHDFALLTSAMHMAWLRNIGGRLKSDYRYSIGLIYNTFPLPKAKLQPLAQAILDARANHPDATLADLYDPDVMPADSRRAHIANDRAVDKLYNRAGFKSERDRVEHLFALYENMVAPMLAKPKKRH